MAGRVHALQSRVHFLEGEFFERDLKYIEGASSRFPLVMVPRGQIAAASTKKSWGEKWTVKVGLLRLD